MSKKYPVKEFTAILLVSINEALSVIGEDQKMHEKVNLQNKWEEPKWLDLTFKKYIELMRFHCENE